MVLESAASKAIVNLHPMIQPNQWNFFEITGEITLRQWKHSNYHWALFSLLSLYLESVAIGVCWRKKRIGKNNSTEMRIPVKSLWSFCAPHEVLWKTPGEIVIVFTSPRRTRGLHSLGWLSSAVTHTQVTHELSKMPRTSQNVARGELEMKRNKELWPMRTSEAHPAYPTFLLSPSCFLNSRAL